MHYNPSIVSIDNYDESAGVGKHYSYKSCRHLLMQSYNCGFVKYTVVDCFYSIEPRGRKSTSHILTSTKKSKISFRESKSLYHDVRFMFWHTITLFFVLY
jgi:hypothetical protein